MSIESKTENNTHLIYFLLTQSQFFCGDVSFNSKEFYNVELSLIFSHKLTSLLTLVLKSV